MGDAVRAFLALPSAARDALARSLTAAGASPALAAALALLVLCALAALALLGPALAMLLRARRGMLAAERAERARARRSPHRAGDLVLSGWEADSCAWVLRDVAFDRVFEATALRLVREGRLRLSQGAPSEGGLRFFMAEPREGGGDVLAVACYDVLFSHGSASTALFRAMSQDEWELGRESRRVERYRDAVRDACVRGGLCRAADPGERAQADRFAVAYVLAALALAVWLSSAVPALLTIALFVGGSLIVASSQGALRPRSLTPAGAEVAERLDGLHDALEQAAADGSRVGADRDSALRALEFAVVLGLDDDVVGTLAERSGFEEAARLHRARSVDVPADDRATAARAAAVEKACGTKGPCSWAARLRAVFSSMDGWCRYESI